MEKKTPPPFTDFPSSVKTSIVFLLLSWISHFFFLYRLWLLGNKMGQSVIDSKLLLQMAAIAILICFFSIRLRNWARVLGIVSNFLAISIYIFLVALFYGQQTGLAIIGTINLIFFSVCTYYLFKKETADFFKMHSPAWGGSDDIRK